jgi:hypothetical protein
VILRCDGWGDRARFVRATDERVPRVVTQQGVELIVPEAGVGEAGAEVLEQVGVAVAAVGLQVAA